jgi:hypothetical protein
MKNESKISGKYQRYYILKHIESEVINWEKKLTKRYEKNYNGPGKVIL